MPSKLLLASITALCAILLGGPPSAAGEPQQMTITAERMWTTRDGTLHAEGGIVVKGEGVTVRAETLRFDPDSDTLHLTGGVIMEEEGGGSFNGDSLVLDLNDLTGGISRGEIILVPNGFRVRGEDLQRLAPEEFSVRKGVFTSCPGDCPEWSFTANEIKVHREGYLTAKHAAFRILNIPVFYTPYLYYPVKTKRQTGLLLPEVRFSEETGLESGWPFFLTLGPHADATLTPRTFSRDGLGLGGEFHYRLRQGGGGDWKGFAIESDDDSRWFFGGEGAMLLTDGIWFRGRFYDAGDPEAADLFGGSSAERRPGVVNRHATLDARSGFIDITVARESLLRDGARARYGDGDDRIDGGRLEIELGPSNQGYLRADLSGEMEKFDDGTERNLIKPSVSLNLAGPPFLSGNFTGEGIISTGGDGSAEDEAYIFSITQRSAIRSKGEDASHRIDLELTLSSVQGAAFGPSTPRDGDDAVQERRLGAARIRSRLSTRKVRWDLEVGAWRDTELDLARGFGSTRMSSGSYFAEAFINPDAQWGLVLPSIDAEASVLKGWRAEAGYQSRAVEAAMGRESTDGYPDLFHGRLRFPVVGVKLSAEASYDLDAGTMADETLSMSIPGRCWLLNLSRSREPERTSWKLSFDLEI